MLYRLALESDLEVLSEIRWLHEIEEEGNLDADKGDFINVCKLFLKDGLGNGNWVYWIAEKDGKIVSNIFINRIKKVPRLQKLSAEIGYVTNVHTLAEYRNQGIGTELLNKVKQWARENEIELLFLWPSEKSVKFYKRLEFTDENEIMQIELL